MEGRASSVLRLLLRCDRSAPRRAREAVRGVAALAPVRDDALMVATELVSNAVLHAGCDPAEEIELLAELEPRTVRIAVVEPGRPGRSPEVSRAPFTDVGAMGLRLVQMLTTRWGVDRNHQVRVWAELAV